MSAREPSFNSNLRTGSSYMNEPFGANASRVQAQQSARFACLISSLFLIGLRQAKVVDGIHGDRCIHGLVQENSRIRPRLVGALQITEVAGIW